LAFLILQAVLPHKALNTTGRIDNLLLARKERMAGIADFHLDAWRNGSGCELVSTDAGN